MTVPVLIVLYVLLIPGTAVYLYYKHRQGADAPLSVGLKAACTTLIVLVSIIGTAAAPESARLFSVLISSGLVLGLVGDVVICQKKPGGFLSGMIYFALGHLCYIGAFLVLSTHRLWAVPVFAVVYLPFLYLAHRLSRYIGNLLIPVAVYGGIIVAMLSLSATVACSVPGGALLLVAAVLFSVSDGLLAYNTFQPSRAQMQPDGLSALQYCFEIYKSLAGTKSDSVSLYCYFIGQSLFAVSLFLLC